MQPGSEDEVGVVEACGGEADDGDGVEAARHRRSRGSSPEEEDGLSGDTVIILLGASDHPLAAFEMLRTVARYYPEKSYMISRLGGKPRQGGKLARWLSD